ncbi:hypothetical protein Lal_00011355 [Lupinus albus]|nr:hypothetical protein Lal_00011355 [Lupinus albus]
MGCTLSKLDNDDTIRRCKHRRRLIKDALYARHHLSTAHSDYCRSLRLTATALSTFASGEPLSVSLNTPAVFLNPNNHPPPPPPPQHQKCPSPPAIINNSKLPHINIPPPTTTTTTTVNHQQRRRKREIKVPHILSESSLSSCYSSPRTHSSNFPSNFFPTAHQSFSETSSVWNWDQFYPPPTPPGSEYNVFHSKHDRVKNRTGLGNEVYESESEEREREEVRCSEWGDHYSTTSSSEEDGEDLRSETVAPAKVMVRHKDLKEIVEAIRYNFEKAAVAGEDLSEILEIGKAQLHRSFTQLRKTVYHSSSLLSSISSTWTSKPPLAVKYRFDTGSLQGPAGPKSLCSTLECLLAWEKKLYKDVKLLMPLSSNFVLHAREGVKIEHEKKLSALQSQEYKGGDESKLEKTKACITRLQSLIIVTSQAVSTTSTAINGLRDSDLVPQLVELCHG